MVFYDYDEVSYLTECNFRYIPKARYPEDEMAAEPWYSIAPNDIFPEEFLSFLFAKKEMKDLFIRYHKNLLTPDFWQEQQALINNDVYSDLSPYPDSAKLIKI